MEPLEAAVFQVSPFKNMRAIHSVEYECVRTPNSWRVRDEIQTKFKTDQALQFIVWRQVDF